MKEEILFYFNMIKQIRTIIDRNSISLLKNIIIGKKKKNHNVTPIFS